jgi:hypothetical protein
MVKRPKCNACEWWEANERECRRYPPQTIAVVSSDDRGEVHTDIDVCWPSAYSDGWCGEFSPVWFITDAHSMGGLSPQGETGEDEPKQH